MEQRIFYFFAHDTITYILKKKGLHFDGDYAESEDYKNMPRRFQACWGDAVLNYREFRRDFFFKLKEDYPAVIFESEDYLSIYLKVTAPKVSRGDSFCMDILRYFAFCVDLAIRCHENGKSELIMFLEEFMDCLEGEIVRQAFIIVGGYASLIRLAEQFVEYKNFKLKEYPIKEDKQIEDENTDFKPDTEENQLEIESLMKSVLESISSSVTNIPVKKLSENDLSKNVQSEKPCENIPTEKICENLPFEKFHETQPVDIKKLPENIENCCDINISVTSETEKKIFDLVKPSTSSEKDSFETQTKIKATENKEFKLTVIAIDNLSLQGKSKSIRKSNDEENNRILDACGPSPRKKLKSNA